MQKKLIWLLFLTLPWSLTAQSINENNVEQSSFLTENAAVKETVDLTLRKFFAPGEFYSSVSSIVKSSKISQMDISIWVDEPVVLNFPIPKTLPWKYKQAFLSDFKQDLEKKLSDVLNAYDFPIKSNILFIAFDRPVNQEVSIFEPFFDSYAGLLLIFVAGGICFAYLVFKQRAKDIVLDPPREIKTRNFASKKKRESHDEEITFSDILKNASSTGLARFLQAKPLRTTAIILFHLGPERAAALISHWSVEKQALLIATLNELHNEQSESLIEESFRIFEIPHTLPITFNLSQTAFQIFSKLSETQKEELSIKMEEIGARI